MPVGAYTTKLLGLAQLNGFTVRLMIGLNMMRCKLVFSAVTPRDVKKINNCEDLNMAEVLELALFHLLTTPFGSSSASVRAAIRERASTPRETWSWLRQKVVDGEICFGWMTETGTIFSTSDHDSVARTFYDSSLGFAPLLGGTLDEIALYGADLEFVFRTRATWHDTHFAAYNNKYAVQRQLLDAHRAAPDTRRPHGKKTIPPGFSLHSRSANIYTGDVNFPSEGDIIEAGARPQLSVPDDPPMTKFTGNTIEALALLGMRANSRIQNRRDRRPAINKRAAPTPADMATKRRTSATSIADTSTAVADLFASVAVADSAAVVDSAAVCANDEETVLCEGGLAQPVLPVDVLVQPTSFDVPAVEWHVIPAYAVTAEQLISYVPPPSPSSFIYEQCAAAEAAPVDSTADLFADAVDEQHDLFAMLSVDKKAVDDANESGLVIGMTGEKIDWYPDTEQVLYFLQTCGH